MISRTPAPSQPLWRRLLADAVSDPGELLTLLGLPADAVAGPSGVGRDFALRVPRGFVARMRPGDPRDPLLLQVLPTAREDEEAVGYATDPLGEGSASPAPGVLHKYRGRVLLVVAGACPVHCRYCFRRHFPYGEHALSGAALDRVVGYLADHPEVDEVILSGGDPLMLPDDRLAAIARRLDAVAHLERLRIHTRTPIVLPERVDDALLGWLTGGRLRPIVVLHANHPREIDRSVHEAAGRLRAAGVPLLNQAVLMAGVNDSVTVLEELSRVLFSAGILPYYLHLLDPVRGAAHFEVGEADGRALVGELATRLPGYLVPRLVRERAGAPAKVPVPIELRPTDILPPA